MPSGQNFLMMNLLMRTNMDLYSHVLMAWNDGYILVFLLIRLIILKSKSLCTH